MEIQRREEMLSFHLYFDIRHNQDGRVVSSTGRPLFTLKEIPWYSFLLECEWDPGLLNADRRIRSLEISKDHTGDRTWDLPSCGAVPYPNAPLLAPLYMI